MSEQASSARDLRRFLPALRVMYVMIVVVLTWSSLIDPNHTKSMAFAFAFVLCLPLVLAAIPVVYVIGAIVWNITGADHGGHTWPITLAYTVMLGLVAIGNLVALRWASQRFRRRRVFSD